jgi:hypothetical protein
VKRFSAAVARFEDGELVIKARAGASFATLD